MGKLFPMECLSCLLAEGRLPAICLLAKGKLPAICLLEQDLLALAACLMTQHSCCR